MDNEQKKRLIALRDNMKSYGYMDGVEELESIFHEIVESDDERIKKIIRLALIGSEDYLSVFYKTHNIRRKQCTDWLEKATETIKRIDEYINDNTANAHDMKDTNPNKMYYRGWDDALTEMSRILEDVYYGSGEKQKEQQELGEDSVYWKAYLDGWNARNLQVAREQKPVEWDDNTKRYPNLTGK